MSPLNENQRRLRRSKQSERDLGKWLLEHNGEDEFYMKIASSTGRVGQITDLQFDVVSKSYAAENKLVKVPKKLLGWWEQIVEVAAKHNKEPMLRIVPSNEGKHPELHIITKERHERLLDMERRYDDFMEMC
jgi:hypothetical protein